MACGTDNMADKKIQDLSGWKGVSHEDLLIKLSGQTAEEMRIYTVTTTKFDKNANTVNHLGSGPNLEGGLATLCTCKHSMRRNHIAEDWKGNWIVGLTSRAINKGFASKHYLFYMMRVEQAFESHAALYKHLEEKNPAALRIKNAVKNPLGDIFKPIVNCSNPLSPRMYELPHNNHSHGHDVNEVWEDDISYEISRTERTATPLLLGDINNTFVWPNPMIRFTPNRGVGNKKLTLGEDFFSLLETHE